MFRMGFASTRAEARQLVSHKAILVNGNAVNIPSFLVKAGDAVSVRDKSKSKLVLLNRSNWPNKLAFLHGSKCQLDKVEGVFKKAPDRDEFGSEINESLIVELYSR